MADILFFNPPRSSTQNDHVFNMTLLWLAGLLQQEGHHVSIQTPSGHDLQNEVLKSIEEKQPHFAIISCKWWNTLYGALEVARLIKKHNPTVHTVLGGHTATVFAMELQLLKFVDTVLMGEVDESLLELISMGDAEKSVDSADCTAKNHPEKVRYLLDDVMIPRPETIMAQPEIVPGYIWIGRGCSFHCFYCLENHESGKRVFGREKPRLRNPMSVAKDIQQLTPRSQLILDFEQPICSETEHFIEDVLAEKPKSFTSCYYFSWGIPSKRLIDILAEKFSFVSICLDVQVFSESLRKTLAEKKKIKPFVSDNSIYEMLSYCDQKDNLVVDATGIVGMPFESSADREKSIYFIEDVFNRFECVRDWRFSPLHVIPGTNLATEKESETLDVIRKGFDDFLDFTRDAYLRGKSYYDSNRTFHPYGVYPVGEPNVIVEFMAEANDRFALMRQVKRSVLVDTHGDFCTVHIEDPVAPMASLIEALVGNLQADIRRLHLSLGRRAWFHGSWIDYTSESGENCAVKDGIPLKANGLEAYLNSLFSRFESVTFDASQTAWGVVAKAVTHASLNLVNAESKKI